MVRNSIVWAVVLGAFLVGCHNAPKQSPPPPQPPPLSYETIRASLRAANPSAQVGQVEAVLPERDLAAVGDVQVQLFQLNDPITFLNNRMETLTMGTVVNIEHGMLHVRYDPPVRGGRAPEVGDIAVRVSEPLRVPAEPLAPVPAPPATAPTSATGGEVVAPAPPPPASAPAPEVTPAPAPAPPPPPPAPASEPSPPAPVPPPPPAPAPGENKVETPPPPPPPPATDNK